MAIICIAILFAVCIDLLPLAKKKVQVSATTKGFIKRKQNPKNKSSLIYIYQQRRCRQSLRTINLVDHVEIGVNVNPKFESLGRTTN